MKEIKVRLYSLESGDCLEIWQTVASNNKHQYFGRDTFGLHTWYYMSDNLYYCERSHAVKEDVTFIVCDQNWKELLRDGNNSDLFPASFPTLDETCKTNWQTISQKYPKVTRDGFCDWLESKMPESVTYSDRINWTRFRFRVEKEEKIHLFDWLGEKYAIIRITKQHTMCDANWVEYFAGRNEPDKYENYARFYGYEFGD